MMKLIDRPRYTRILVDLLNTPQVKVLKGVRRCGKSTLLDLLAQTLIERGIPARNVLKRRFDDFSTPLNPDASWLLGLCQGAIEQADASYPLYVLFDEIQEVSGWEQVIRRFEASGNAQVYITGSNAQVLSSDLATLLAGRYVEINVSPLSFEEYRTFCDTCGWTFAHCEEQLLHYLAFGGMPGLFDYAQNDLDGIARLLTAIYDAVIVKDVAKHARIADYDLLEKLARYVFQTSGSLLSTRNIVNTLTSAGRKAASETVDGHLKALCDALVVSICEQIGVGGKQVLRPLRKFYPVDTGLRNLLWGLGSSHDIGFELENAVYNELVRRGYTVFVGALSSAEIDFVAQRGAERQYVQVTQTLLDDRVYQREVDPLEEVRDSFPKLVVTLDRYRTGVTDTGVRIRNAVDWLTEGQSF